MEGKQQFAAICILTVGGLQCLAWYLGKNGQVFAFTSLVIGLIAGKILGIKFNGKNIDSKKI